MATTLNPQTIREPHAILVRTDRGPGDHWDCTCGRWTLDTDETLSIEQVQKVLVGFEKHKHL